MTGDEEALARMFHDTYERLAPEFDYSTRVDSAVPWEDVPEPNKSLMIAVADAILAAGYRVAPDAEFRRRSNTPYQFGLGATFDTAPELSDEQHAEMRWHTDWEPLS